MPGRRNGIEVNNWRQPSGKLAAPRKCGGRNQNSVSKLRYQRFHHIAIGLGSYSTPSRRIPNAVTPEMYLQTIVCFANSRKDGRRCVAGKTWLCNDQGAWVRPVSRDASRALPPATVTYQNGGQPSLLDIVQVPLQARLPEGHQPENSLVDDAYPWIKSGRLNWADIDQWVDHPQQLWHNDSQSFGMLNNRVDASVQIHSSLQLIRVPALVVKLIAAPLADKPHRQVVVGEFVYHGVRYRTHVTDSQVEAQCRANPVGRLDIAQAVLCISLGNCFRQHYYKLVAGVLFDGRFS